MLDLDSEIYEIDRLYYQTNGLFAGFDKLQGTNQALFKSLHALFVSGLVTQKQIMQDYEMPKQTVNGVMSSLQKQGFVELCESENDKREKIVRLTKSGEIYARNFLEPHLKFSQKIYKKMGSRKTKTFLKSLKYYKEALKEALNDEISALNKA